MIGVDTNQAKKKPGGWSRHSTMGMGDMKEFKKQENKDKKKGQGKRDRRSVL